VGHLQVGQGPFPLTRLAALDAFYPVLGGEEVNPRLDPPAGALVFQFLDPGLQFYLLGGGLGEIIA
jgi:hypothetical protein